MSANNKKRQRDPLKVNYLDKKKFKPITDVKASCYLDGSLAKLSQTRAQQQERSNDNREKISAYLSKYNEVTLDLESIEARGGMIEGEDLRSGRRQFKKDGITLMKSRSSKRDRKESLTSFPIHPDAQNGFDALVQFGNKKFNNALEGVAELDSSTDDENEELEDDVGNRII